MESDMAPITQTSIHNPETLKALLIEDSPVQAQIIQGDLLEAKGFVFNIEWVDCLSHGLERLKKGNIDVVLLDLALPDSLGLETFMKVKPQTQAVPVLILTTSDDDQMALEAVRLGAQDYLIKGQVDGKRLARLMRHAIERKRLEQLKDEFVGLVSYELGNPLSAIKSSISLVAEEICGSATERQKKPLALALRALDRLRRITDNLLDVAKLEFGRFELHCESFNIVPLVQETCAIFQPRAQSKGLTIEVMPGPNNIEVFADKDKITQVLTNLLSNALKFTEKGSVKVSFENKENEVECRVLDTGPGIAKEDLPKVFNKFQQLGQPTNGEKGTGLGLTICRRIIELHEGNISVESKLGQGTSFIFTIPSRRITLKPKPY